MRVTAGVLLVSAALALAFVAEGRAGEPPDTDAWLLPGRASGTTRSAWIAPYVQETQVSVGTGGVTHVRWFRPDGTVLREIQGKGAQDVRDRTVHGIRDTWSVRLREVPWGSGGIERGEDDSTLVHYWIEGASLRADIYKEGKLLNSLGPFHKARRLELGEDGSTAVLTLNESGSARVVVFAPGGKPSFEADAGGDARVLSVAPGGLGVVLEGNGERHVENELTWLSKKGTSRKLKIEPNPWLSRWVPGTARQVVTYGLAGENPRFRLVDWESGETVWDIADPAKGTSSRMEGVAVEGDLLLLAGIESRDGWRGEWCRASEALDLGTGKLVASWCSGGFGEPGLPVPKFMRLDGRLWLVADDAFAPFPVEDIRKKTNGWQ
jgi:hypothetical protein